MGWLASEDGGVILSLMARIKAQKSFFSVSHRHNHRTNMDFDASL
jgi:hypothetical protein